MRAEHDSLLEAVARFKSELDIAHGKRDFALGERNVAHGECREA